MTFDPVDTSRIAAEDTNTDETGGGRVSSSPAARLLEFIAGALLLLIFAAALAEAVTGGVQ